MQIAFLGGSYTGVSTNLNDQRSINWFPEAGGPDGKSVIALIGVPGKEIFVNLGDALIRGLHAFGAYLYAVQRNKLYRVSADGTVVDKGTLSSLSGRVEMADNGTQICIVDGTHGWLYDSSNETFSQITASGFPAADTVTYQDGYFIVNRSGTGQFFISGLYDGTTWNALDYATAESSPDNLLRVFSDHGELWLFGEDSIEPWYNAGALDFPFAKIDGAHIEWGLAARDTVCKFDNSLVWLGKNRQGGYFVVRANGYTPQIISTPAINWQISQYGNVSNATAFSYAEAGHSFYCLTFPDADVTWVYDASTQLWHERQSHNMGRDLSDCYAYFNGKHYVSDYRKGILYHQDLTLYTENGDPIKSMRQAQHLSNNGLPLFVSKLQVDLETGVGLDGNATEPQMMLQWSDDGGHTWSSERWVGMGKIGNFRRRAIWRRLGRSFDRVYRLTITDPVKRVLIAANADVKVGR